MESEHLVITGGSSGIGLDLALAYAASGWSISIVARDEQRLQQAVEACEQRAVSPTQRFYAYSLDVSNPAELESLSQQIEATSGTPDLVIMSAGICYSKRFIDDSDASFEQVFLTNVMGSRAIANAFLPGMIAKQKGQLCFVSSMAGLVPVYGYSAYNTSKFALLGMAGALRQELYEYNISVSVLCPPEVDTPLIAEEAKHILPQTRLLKNVGGTLTVDAVTRSTIRGLKKKRFLILPGFMAKLTHFQARLAPRLSAWVTQQLVNRATSSR